MNASRKKCDKFFISDFTKGVQPHFETVRMRSKSYSNNDESFVRYPLFDGAIQFPSVSRSNKSNDTNSVAPSFSLKIFETPLTTSTINEKSVLSFLKSSTNPPTKSSEFQSLSTSEFVSTSSSDNFFEPNRRNLFQTPLNVGANGKLPSSAIDKFHSLNSSSSDSIFFTTPKKRNCSRTPKSSSSNFSESVNSVVIAITEGRGQARGEVGIVAIDVKRPVLTLCEISDTQTYVNTLSKINILNPAEILVPNTFCDTLNPSKLYQMICDNFPNCNLRTVQRKFFNENNGLQQIQNICLPEFSAILLMIPRKFYALAAAAALLKFAEFERNMIFSPQSVRVNFESGNDITFIDLETAQKLELVHSQNMGNTCPENTLYGVMNNCSTLSGQKRLRSLILQPSSNEEEISKRLDCVEELVNNQDLFFSLKSILPKFWDVEQLLSLSMQLVNLKDSSKCVELQINFILLLKTSLEALPSLQKSLNSTKTKFFSAFRKNLDNAQYKIMLEKIYEVVNSDAHLSPKFDISQFQRCFCIKTGIDAFLDVARLAYTELVDDFNGIVDDLIKEYNLPLTIRTLKNKGPILQMKLGESNSNFNLKDLPSVFVQVEKSRSSITMTTKELLFLKERMNHFIHEIQALSSVIIFELMKDIREYIGNLFVLCENIAELDLVLSFAQTSRNFGFLRPLFSSDCMILKSSEHPILHRVSVTKPVANDVFVSIDSNMSIITGPNMGGKSVYIRQIALLQIMAQSGCFIPAEFAQFRITDRIFSRIGFTDDIECNASSFIVELKEMNYIMKSLTPCSLVIIDELCRGTSAEEGASIAFAILEELQATTAFIFVTTHFPFLTKLEELYCNVTNCHFDTLEINSEDGDSLPSLVYTHRLVPGVMKLEHYGLKLARVTAIPEDVLQLAKEVTEKLSAEWKATSFFDGNITESKIIDTIFLKLIEMVDNETLTIASLKDIVEHAFEMRMNLVRESEDNLGIDTSIGPNDVFQPAESSDGLEDSAGANIPLHVELVENDALASDSRESVNFRNIFEVNFESQSSGVDDRDVSGDDLLRYSSDEESLSEPARSIKSPCTSTVDETVINGTSNLSNNCGNVNYMELESTNFVQIQERYSGLVNLHGMMNNLNNKKFHEYTPFVSQTIQSRAEYDKLCERNNARFNSV